MIRRFLGAAVCLAFLTMAVAWAQADPPPPLDVSITDSMNARHHLGAWFVNLPEEERTHNLSEMGPTDWVHWGASSAFADRQTRKNIPNPWLNMSLIQPEGFSTTGAWADLLFPSGDYNGLHGYSWNPGDDSPNRNKNFLPDPGVDPQIYKGWQFAPPAGQLDANNKPIGDWGFRVTTPVPPVPSTLYIHVSAWNAIGALTISLVDAEGAVVGQNVYEDLGIAANMRRQFRVNLDPAPAGHQLVAEYLFTENTHTTPGSVGGIRLSIATLDVDVEASEEPWAMAHAITGPEGVGGILTGNYTYYGPNDEGESLYRWLRADAPDGEYMPIGGATGPTYALTVDDLGKFVKFEVTPVDVESTVGVVALSPPTGEIGDEVSPLILWDPYAVGGGPGTNQAGYYNYGEGIRSTHNTTVGLSEPWSGVGTWGGNFNTGVAWNVVENTLSYSSNGRVLATKPGSLDRVGSNATFRPLSVVPQEDTYYVSFVAVPVTESWFFVGLTWGTGTSDQDHGLFMNVSPTSARPKFNNVWGAPGAYTYPEGTERDAKFIVFRVEIGVGVTAWLNPGLGKTEAQVDGDEDYAARWFFAWPTDEEGQPLPLLAYNRLFLRSSGTGSAFDEFRMAISNDGFSAEAAWAAVTPHEEAGPELPSATNLVIDGEPRVGETLTGSYDFTGGSDLSEVRWLRADSAGGEYTAIDGATSATYTLTAADAGKFITFEVTPIDESGPGVVAQSAPTGPAYVLGDFNGDGVLSGLDIPGFKQALADPDGWAKSNPDSPHPNQLGDFNGDGVFSGLDIPGFKQALAGN